MGSARNTQNACQKQCAITLVITTMDLEKGCNEHMTGLQNFNEQEPRIENTECEKITSEEGKDAIITGLFRENFE